MAKITSCGDAGDCVYTLCVMKHIPNGPHELLIEEKDELTATGKNGMAEKLEAFIRDLVIEQPYISGCRMMRPDDRPYWRSGGFRKAGLHRRTETLMSAHLNHLNQVTGAGVKVDASQPWVALDQPMSPHGYVVVNRTNRYTNNKFPWQAIVNHYQGQIAFVGLPHEYQAFCSQFGHVEYIVTENMRELALAISGSSLFIGNQSCANALAEAMKHPTIQETSLQIPDCIFKRDNVQHVWDGGCTLPAIGGAPELKINPTGLHVGLVSTMRTPPNGGWRYPGVPDCETFFQCYELVSQLPSMRGKPQVEIENAIKQVALDRVPDYFRPPTDGENVKLAKEFAGYN